ncbi:hypothetical protein BC830DRAFT_429876 [Chytriomyces sp. MP71]|nr:hypothetical protein BC830DRAFT_429876 [Chytriomyces sp. MP71]
MKSAAKQALTYTARGLGMCVMRDFTSDCTHLAMSSLKVTMKTVQAVAYGRHIVTGAWVKECERRANLLPELGAATTKFEFPKEEDYLPVLEVESDSAIPGLRAELFRPVDTRARIFNGKKFLFMDAQEVSRHWFYKAESIA